VKWGTLLLWVDNVAPGIDIGGSFPDNQALLRIAGRRPAWPNVMRKPLEMHRQPDLEPDVNRPPALLAPAPRSRLARWMQAPLDVTVARLISAVGSPPVVGVVITAGIAALSSVPVSWGWAVLYVTLVVGVPLVYVIQLVRHNRVTDIDVRLRHQRGRPLGLALAAAFLGWVMLAAGGAPVLMQMLAIAVCVQTAAIILVTRWWKISVHSATAAGAATIVWCVAGTAWPLVVGVPLVAWSRVRLRHHTLAQTAAGALVGILVFGGVLLML